MRSMYKLMQGVLFVGQLGFMLVTPPLVLIYFAHLLQESLGLGIWVMVVAILVGLLSSACSVVNLFRKLMKRKTDASSNDNDRKQ